VVCWFKEYWGGDDIHIDDLYILKGLHTLKINMSREERKQKLIEVGKELSALAVDSLWYVKFVRRILQDIW
jgi:hypothetical protein